VLYPDDRHWMWRAYEADRSNPRDIMLNTAPWIDGYPTHNARFAVNDPTFVTLNGPFDSGARDENTVGYGSPNIEITLGKLDSGLTAVSGWARVTANTVADYMANAWIDQGVLPGSPRLGLPVDTIRFTAVKGGANPDSQVLRVVNTGGGAYGPLALFDSAAWLSATLSGGSNSQTILNKVSVTSLDTGRYVTTVEVSGGGAANTVRYTVVLRVSYAPRVLTTITLSPDTALVAPGDSVLITGIPADQYGDPFAATVDWTVSGGGAMNPIRNGQSTSPASTFTSSGAAGTFTVSATSGAVFGTAVVRVSTQAIPSIAVLAPGPGDSLYHVYDTLWIRWSATEAVSAVSIDLSLDSGESYVSLLGGGSITRADPRWGAFAWVITPTVPGGASALTSRAVVIVSQYTDRNVHDWSRAFRIAPAAGVRGAAGPSRTRAKLSVVQQGRGVTFLWTGAGECAVRLLDLCGALRAEARLSALQPRVSVPELGPGAYLVDSGTGGRRAMLIAR